jgi:hypothetical protein
MRQHQTSAVTCALVADKDQDAQRGVFAASMTAGRIELPGPFSASRSNHTVERFAQRSKARNSDLSSELELGYVGNDASRGCPASFIRQRRPMWM